MDPDDISAESLLNMILDGVDDMIVINDSERNIVWMNRAARVRLGVSPESFVGAKCHKLFGATCCCDSCTANLTLGGPQRSGCSFKCRNMGGDYICEPMPYYKDGKLRIVIQHIRPADKNE